jgi:hypothetical protein
MKAFRDRLDPQGRAEIFVAAGIPALHLGAPLPSAAGFPRVYQSCDIDFSNVTLLQHISKSNLILGQGKDRIIQTLSTGFFFPIARLAIGDRGTLPSDSTVPKVPVDNDIAHPMTTLYNEVYRADADATVLDVGAGVHEIKFIKIFSAVDVPITAFSNQAKPVVNEVGLVMADLLSGTPLPRAAVAPPTAPPADEILFSIRTFKSVPFEIAQNISVTIRYTIYIE